MPNEVGDRMFKEITLIQPGAARIRARLPESRMDRGDSSCLAAAPHSPSLYLRPLTKGDEGARTTSRTGSGRQRSRMRY